MDTPTQDLSKTNSAPTAPTPDSDPVSNPPTPNNAPPSTYIEADAPSSSKMKLILIVFVVMLIAIGAGYYYLTMQKPADTSTSNTTQPTSQTQPKVTPTETMALVLSSPTDSTLVKTDKVKVSGKTSPNATVVIYTETRDTSLEADEKGNFETEIALSGGINTLTVTAFSDKGEEKTVTLNVTYDNQT